MARKLDTSADAFDWFGALERSTRQMRDAHGQAPLWLVVECRCGALEDRGREPKPVVDLRGEDVTVIRNEGGRPCRACPHYIHHGAMSVVRYFGNTTTVRDHFHTNCVRL